MDPSLIRDADPGGVALYFLILFGIIVGTAVFNRSRYRDWIDEAHGRGSIDDDDWGLPRR